MPVFAGGSAPPRIWSTGRASFAAQAADRKWNRCSTRMSSNRTAGALMEDEPGSECSSSDMADPAGHDEPSNDAQRPALVMASVKEPMAHWGLWLRISLCHLVELARISLAIKRVCIHMDIRVGSTFWRLGLSRLPPGACGTQVRAVSAFQLGGMETGTQYSRP